MLMCNMNLQKRGSNYRIFCSWSMSLNWKSLVEIVSECDRELTILGKKKSDFFLYIFITHYNTRLGWTLAFKAPICSHFPVTNLGYSPPTLTLVFCFGQSDSSKHDTSKDLRFVWGLFSCFPGNSVTILSKS